MYMQNEEFLGNLNRLQSDRLDDQRCSMPSSMAEQNTDTVDTGVSDVQKRKEPIDEVLLAGPPYPLVVLPVSGDYWQEGTNHVCLYDNESNLYIPSIDASDLVIEDDVGYCCYKNFFQKQEHYNFTGDCSLGSLLLSTKYEENCVGTGEDEGEIVRVILRSSERTVRGAIATKELPQCPGPAEIVKTLVPDLLEDFTELNFQPVIYPKASSLITRFDEHGHAEKFKVGVIFQKVNQTHERQYFGNKTHSKAMHDFLQIVGNEVELFGFKGYSGGLDTKNNQTGHKSVYTNFKGREIMFHVSTLLPYTTGDPQQLQRKRHIGNDIIAIIFQDENTPFCPSSIRSSFLHIFIVVQAVEPYTKNARYKITITSKEDVPEFGPSLPSPAVFSKNDPLLREYFLTKLLNAELAAFKAKQFSTLMERTRKLLFEDLVSTLAKKSQEMMAMNSGDSLSSSQPRGKLLNSLRNAFRSESFDRGPEVAVRSRSLENLVEKEDRSDDETDKSRKKKRNYQLKRYSVSEKTRKTFRPKSKSLFHSMSADGPNGRFSETRQDRVPSPSSMNRDHSPSGSFTPPRSPIDEAPKTPPAPVITMESLRPLPRNDGETFVSHVDEATFHGDKVNGLSSSSKFREDGTYQPQDSRVPSLVSKPKAFSDSDAAEIDQKDLRDVRQSSLIETLRGDVYKLSKEKTRLQRDNEGLREDVNAIKEAMIKQAEDLCESQYQLTLLRARVKQKGPLTASVV